MPNFKPWEYADEPQTIRVKGKPTPNPKKITGTRLACILGANKYKSEFGAWCEIMRVAEEPFEGNKFTEAGTAIEPKLLEWCKAEVSPHIVTPFEWFGKTTEAMGYDHFPSEPIFGGMWDALVLAGNGTTRYIEGVVEAKTSSRPQDWANGVPASYAIQGLAYAYLLGIDRVFFPVRFMEPDEYDNPERCECDDSNTVLYELKVSESAIDEMMTVATDWHLAHVKGNISPAFDEKRDKAILAVLRKSEVKTEGLEALAKEASVLEARIEIIRSESSLDALEKRLKALKDKQLKPEIVKLFTTKDKVVTAYGWQVTKLAGSASIDKEALERDNLLDKYTVIGEPTYRLIKEKTDA